ncbi:MAG: hypothetical protein LBP98_02520 [Tannerella sp.]|jgi:hypothetical protein|nr:hypothetical protein [Tannerella sp.]
MDVFEKGAFGYDFHYLLEKDSTLVLLSDGDGQAQIIVSPGYQAKVFTSSARGMQGKSLGYVSYRALEAETPDEHMNGYGGENRFWIGPEGGKYSVFFAPGAEQVYAHWHTPPAIDTEPWDVVFANRRNVSLKKEMEVTNYAGSRLKLRIDRSVSLVETPEIRFGLGLDLPPGVETVAYLTENVITNLNDFEWTRETGAPCIWILDMFHPGPRAVTLIPFRQGDERELGKIVTSDYFGEIPAHRLQIRHGVICLKTDGKYRSKLGLNGRRTCATAGNYDPDAGRLTVITYEVNRKAVYLSQEWDPDKEPLSGDAMNAYNDGPLEDGSLMGPFLELESVSPAAFLPPLKSLSHKHTVYHFLGNEKELSPLMEKLFGLTVEEVNSVFESPGE